MTLDEIRAEKAKLSLLLAEFINGAVKEFQEKTGADVASIGVSTMHYQTLGSERRRMAVGQVDVELWI